MSYFNGPKSITDGLVLCLDAGNPKSYPGSGATWYDLSPGKTHATMVGTVPFSVDVTNCFNFATATGGGSYDVNMGFSFGSNMVATGSDFTFECWVKDVPATAAYSQQGLFANSGGDGGFRYGIGRDGMYWLLDSQESGIGFTVSYDTTKWHHIVSTWDRTSLYKISLYKNGVYENYGSIASTFNALINTAPGLIRSNCCGIYTGKLGIFKVYNRLLTTDEILQNYNSAKSRFGL